MLALHDTQVRYEAGFFVSTQSELTVSHQCHKDQLSDTDKMRCKDQLSHTDESLLIYTLI